MSRAAVFAAAALCAAALCAEEAKAPLVVYKELLKVSSVRGFHCSTNGAEAAGPGAAPLFAWPSPAVCSV